MLWDSTNIFPAPWGSEWGSDWYASLAWYGSSIPIRVPYHHDLFAYVVVGLYIEMDFDSKHQSSSSQCHPTVQQKHFSKRLVTIELIDEAR